MLTDKKILGKLEQIEQRYGALRFRKIADIPVEMCQTKTHFRQIPGDDSGVEWTPAPAGTKWGGSWVTAWFKGEVELPEECAGKRVFVRPNAGGETLFVVDGQHRGVFDENHPVVMVTGEGTLGHKYVLGFEAYSGHSYPGTQPHDKPVVIEDNCKTLGGVELVLEREDVTAFVFDLKVLKDVLKSLDDNSLRRNTLIAGLAKVYASVDMLPEETVEENWRPKLAAAREIMKPMLDAQNGSTAPSIGIVGHSHMDTAWLWPLTETWRKCARTYSSVLNLMEQYPEFMFFQSSPCHTEKIKEEYPDIFDRMKEKVAEGRYEPNGGMWVEPDCNVPSGESLVRQLLVGQQMTREWFGYTSNTLWLPDVFGYSAALPQILQGCDVEYFCTTKIGWNDTTRFPYDTFVWKGIDGTSVIAHYHFLHCWPDPLTMTNQWNWVQHKDVQDRMIMAYGYGDGGGGPMAEMLEVARRVKNLEGSPKAEHINVGKFMDGIRDELGDKLPVWSGELYLEAHRGTLTSVSEIKRGNRETEFALREAELLSTLATLKGAEYPTERFLSIWKTLLTNQFHDILPGSSIAAVNDLAIETFHQCIADAKAISTEAVKYLSGGDSGKLLLVNTLSWDRAGEMTLDGVPAGMAPVGDGIVTQQIEGPDGAAKVAVKGLTIPSLGMLRIELGQGTETHESPFSIDGDMLETPFAIVAFDGIGRIVSLVDKASGREVVNRDGALNTLLLGEDVPESWDNWDLDSDQRLKMHVQDELVSRSVVANGPLQLRIRSEYKVGEHSSIIQDTVFHSDTPRIDFDTVIDWADTHKLFKAGFELNVLSDYARHEIQYGHAERPTHTNLPQDRARFEVAAHKWSDLSDNGFGVAILNDCKYGISVTGSELRLTLIKSGVHPDPRGDAGRHTVTYSVLPHASSFSVESVVRPAYELNIKPSIYQAGPNSVSEGLVSVDASNVIVESVKWAEDGKGFVVRLYEAGKAGCNTKVTVNVPVNCISQTNLMEEKPQPLEVTNGAVEVYFRPFEIKTLYCALAQ